MVIVLIPEKKKILRQDFLPEDLFRLKLVGDYSTGGRIMPLTSPPRSAMLSYST